MTGCQCERIDTKFDAPYVAEKLARYRQEGPDPSTRALIEALRAEGIAGKTLLDIGGGVGAVQHELLESGLSSAVEVEASEAYATACREEAERRGHADRITHFSGDFSSLADGLDAADIVTLDRSLCCWDDMTDLVSRSASKTGQLYGLVYPRDVWWVRYGWRAFSNTRQLLHRSPMRVFAHRTFAVEKILAESGLTRHRYAEVGVWQIVLYRRAAL